MERAHDDATERVSSLEMRVETAERTPESEQRWQQRTERLAAWLLSEWQRESQRGAA